MTLEQYFDDKQISQTDLVLIDRLKRFSKESDFLVGLMALVETEAEKTQLINFIDKGKDVSYESILLYALELDLNREEKSD